MAIPFVQPTEEDQELSNQQLQIMMALYMALQQVLRSRSFRHSSRNHQPRRQGNTVGSREHGLVLLDQDIAGLPLPDLVSSAMQQLPPPSPQVTVSAPTSPTRDATFQFPECSGTNNVAAAAAAAAAASYANVARNNNYENEDEEGAPVPTPRPRPRRRRPINVRVPSKKTSLTLEPACNGDSTCCEHPGHALRNGQWWISIGANLRNIADDFQASKTKNAELENSRLSLVTSGFPSNTNGNSLPTEDILRSMIPASIRETTLWVTVALYLGWRLVSRLR
ncbi:uncharacterized protein LOC118441041 isoform X1 [Vespa mandarinia]|uniref:uncharacterized protein LOC118441041 isoform X1 n=1 Tax=Vespa mandarinia TaxID=7446 RepID=UPI001610CEEA|nr:uncharacterized protein LOC118441041 isoform X1 [Vespa mandarinia]XP_035720825.1 uncharacterized protein LOC118441041 isoform X1 [Vespa mandarinia]XP_046826229.1 uncharacterized protein LOC124427394 isoform X1 [Vespa crabro]